MGHPAPGNHQDPAAIALRDGLADGVASAIRVIVLSGDVETVVLGGGVTALGDRMLSRVVDELAAGAAASPFLKSLRLAERVELLPPGSPAAALGAALIGAAAEAPVAPEPRSSDRQLSDRKAVFHG